ncbi:lipase, hormone-sensitive a [Seriola aureovittata]|uniref:lipase, hormone-sensitive a n=1 Tax=Seriola aureovittata TaxID=2871759 RepID=UPI0024BDA187|nr:lipase, hormone-sensitive a [Seriola aureovittata]XP_056254972.1 lipase, hormone-sensitive a [Seriola aureovittata]
MDYKVVFSTLETVCEDNIAILCGPSESSDLPYGTVAERLITCLRQIQEHGRALEPVVASFTAIYHHYDFDAQTPGNGYRTLVKVLHSCLLHIIHKGRYIASNYNSAFFRAEHNASEMEAYCSALCQLRALLHLAEQLIRDNDCGQLYSLQDRELGRRLVQEYSSMHKACFYGRCLGFQFSPALRPFLQTVVISMVSYGETYGKQQSGLGLAALSLLTSGKYVIDPDLRGAEFERITQNLDLQFWKSFWNLTESGLITGFNRIASNQVQVNFTLTVPPVTLRLPLASDPSLTATVSPPIAHWGPGPVHMRLISYELREGQDSEELLAFSRADPPPISVSHLPWVQKQPRSPWLLIHFHGGGFVAQTSRSHENYIRSWSKELNVPVLSVDYSLSPEAPFPRALEECFYAYCWALNHCHLLGSTAERVCLAGDSAGGNLCITVSMKAMSSGIRVPDGIMAAYPATLLTTDASPSRLLTLIDPMLPLGVLAKCINAYAGTDSCTVQPAVGSSSLSALGRDTALLLSDLTQGASNWIQSFLDPMRSSGGARSLSSPQRRSQSGETGRTSNHTSTLAPGAYPQGFEPLRSECLAFIRPTSCPIIRNPFVSPLLAPNNLLRGLPPVHIVASALDALLDDSVMFAKKLRDMGQPVTLTVVEDLPHGFLSLSQLAKETVVATEVCVARMKEIFEQENPTSALHKRP